MGLTFSLFSKALVFKTKGLESLKLIVVAIPLICYTCWSFFFLRVRILIGRIRAFCEVNERPYATAICPPNLNQVKIIVFIGLGRILSHLTCLDFGERLMTCFKCMQDKKYIDLNVSDAVLPEIHMTMSQLIIKHTNCWTANTWQRIYKEQNYI